MQSDPSQSLMEMVLFARKFSIESTTATGDTFIPLVIQARGENADVRQFLTETLEEGLSQARAWIEDAPVEVKAYVLAYEGTLTIEEEKWSAFIFEAAERGEPQAHLFAQRYLPETQEGQLEVVGNLIYLGNTDQMLRS